MIFFFFSAEAVFARCLSAMQGERIDASKQLSGPSTTKYSGDKKEFINDIKYVSYLASNKVIPPKKSRRI